MEILSKIDYEEKKENLKKKLAQFAAISVVIGGLAAILGQNWTYFWVGPLIAVCVFTPMKILKACGMSPVVSFILSVLVVSGAMSVNQNLLFLFVAVTILDIGYGIFKTVQAKRKENETKRENADA